MESVTDILAKFTPITLEEMSAVKLMNRIDTKYLVYRNRLPEILSRLTEDYFVQENAGKRISHYNTLYYDTPDAQMYVAHHDRKLTRQKLRARIYCDTGTAFCEIKNKNNKTAQNYHYYHKIDHNNTYYNINNHQSCNNAQGYYFNYCH